MDAKYSDLNRDDLIELLLSAKGDLAGEDLSFADIRSVDLKNADLSDTSL